MQVPRSGFDRQTPWMRVPRRLERGPLRNPNQKITGFHGFQCCPRRRGGPLWKQGCLDCFDGNHRSVRGPLLSTISSHQTTGKSQPSASAKSKSGNDVHQRHPRHYLKSAKSKSVPLICINTRFTSNSTMNSCGVFLASVMVFNSCNYCMPNFFLAQAYPSIRCLAYTK